MSVTQRIFDFSATSLQSNVKGIRRRIIFEIGLHLLTGPALEGPLEIQAKNVVNW